jgi:hypothetical protein
MAPKTKLTIILEQEVWNEEVVSQLVKMGHTVKAIQSHNYDLIIGPRAWRLPNGTLTVDTVANICRQAAKLIKAGKAQSLENPTLNLEVPHGMDDTETSVEEEDGKVVERVSVAYHPATKPGGKKKRVVARGGYAATDQGCDTGEGC